MQQIRMNTGEYFIVDDEDFPVLSRFSWHHSGHVETWPHANYTQKSDIPGKTKTTHNIPAHVFLDKNRNGKRAVPINGNYLDCRKENINFVFYTTKKQHCRKVSEVLGHAPKSKYKGVSTSSKTNARGQVIWRAYINPRVRDGIRLTDADKKRKQIYIGTFMTEKEAAIAYNEKAREIYGEDAWQNIIED